LISFSIKNFVNFLIANNFPVRSLKQIEPFTANLDGDNLGLRDRCDPNLDSSLMQAGEELRRIKIVLLRINYTVTKKKKSPRSRNIFLAKLFLCCKFSLRFLSGKL
jgi:hypothetical protein